MEKDTEIKLDIGTFDFTPAWAKKDAGVSVGKIREEGEGGNERKPFKKSFDKSADRKMRREKFQHREFVAPLDADIKVLPDTKALGTIIRKLQNDFHAYKLKDLAYFFLDNPSSILLKVMPKDETQFFQCKVCSFASTSQDEVIAHIVSSHIGDYFVAKEVEVEPPKGNFNCIARCSMSGVLLGPPNIHEFNSVIKEMLATKFPNMSEEEYRSKIEIVRDESLINEWRAQATKKTLYFAKSDGENAVGVTREQAEGEIKRNYVPSLVQRQKNLMITADKALACPIKSLVKAVRIAIDKERRTPQSMCYALHGAFHHRKFNFFRVNDSRGQEFVSRVEYRVFDSKHAIEELRKIADFITQNPCSMKSEIVTDPDSEKQLNWLISTGHVVAFTNGAFSAVEKFPKYGPQWRKKTNAAVKPDEEEKTADSASIPVQEAQVEQAEAVAVAEEVENNQTGNTKDESSTELA
jgi:hypothetical protein